jgi:hypothetical protein
MMDISETERILSSDTETQKLLLKKRKCDKYDYLAAVACGAIGGVVDVFLVGSPLDGKSVLGSWTDKQVDNVVMHFAKKLGWNGESGNIKSAIGYLENRVNGTGFRVNYDQISSPQIPEMSTKNHHMKSLGHSPDIIGLFFSILNQFTGTSTFLSNGQIITIDTETQELQGGNLMAKLFCGVANWFGHLMSDVAGSSGGSGRGTGIVAPFYELFGLCNFGKFQVGKSRMTLAQLATKAFENGYDFRFSIATAIPVVITNLSIQLIWAIRRHYQHKVPLSKCIPSSKYADLRIMLIFGNGTLCVIDGLDAAIRSGGNALTLFMRLNLVAWCRFAKLVIKEVAIRVGIAQPLQKLIDAFVQINAALDTYLTALEKIDFARFQQETAEYKNLFASIDDAETPEEFQVLLLQSYEKLSLEKPWQGDFDKHMANRNGTLKFS